MQRYKIVVKFSKPVNGYWDYGKKDGGEFTAENTVPFLNGEHPGVNKTIRWGCYRLNFWFNCGSGKSWKAAAQHAAMRLRAMCKVEGVVIKIEELASEN